MNVNLEDLGGHYIKLKGYNKRMNSAMSYKVAKQPFDSNWRQRGVMSNKVVLEHLKSGGWIGWVPPAEVIIVDIDDADVGEFVTPYYNTLKIKTPNGYQLLFKADSEIYSLITNTAKEITRLGIIVDYRTDKGQIVVPTEGTEGRVFLSSGEPEDFPRELLPLKRKQMNDLSLLPLDKGERNDRMSTHAASMARLKVPREECLDALNVINSMIDSITDKEIRDMVKGAYEKFYKESSDEDADEANNPWFAMTKKGVMFKYPERLIRHMMEDHGVLPMINKDYYVYNERKYIMMEEDGINDLLISHLGEDMVRLSWLNDAKSMLDKKRKPIEIFNRRDDLLFFRNGSFQITDAGLDSIPDSMDYYSTVEVPYCYSEGNYCENWQNNLDKILPDADDQMILQELMGYLLVPNNDAKKIFVLFGPGDTGKTLVLRVIEKLLGHENICTVDLSMLSERFQSTALIGKLADIIDDQDFVYLKSSGIIKSITGGGTIGAEVKGGKHFNFRNYARIVYTCNEIPRAADRGDAWHSRHLILPFLKKIPEKEKNRHIMKTFDFDGIASWAVEGLMRLRAKNWKFNTSKNVDDAASEYQRINDPWQDFLSKCCIMEEGAKETYTNMILAYTGFCGTRPSASKFSRMMQDYPKVTVDRRIYFDGIKLNENAADIHGATLVDE